MVGRPFHEDRLAVGSYRAFAISIPPAMLSVSGEPDLPVAPAVRAGVSVAVVEDLDVYLGVVVGATVEKEAGQEEG